jgi:threonine dehydrogenase-like Zn-dependent dehydrogenase
MRALRVSITSPRAPLALVAGRWKPDLYRGGPGSPLRLVEMPVPDRPPGWVRVRPTLAGICASDRKLLHLTGFGRTIIAHFGMPRSIVPGHEVVGVVTEAEPGSGWSEGDRVVAEPLVSCVDKGLPQCPQCATGSDEVCEHWADAGALHGGPGFGHLAAYGGGWAEELVAPARRLFPVPPDVPDRVAVLAEPWAIGVHAVLRNLPDPGARVLVIGPGSIGLALIMALRTLVPDVEVTAAGVHPFSAGLARQAGAHAFLHGTRRELVEAAGRHLGATIRGNRISGPVLDRGFDVVYDTLAFEQTLDDALRMTRARGQVVIVGTAFRQKVDWTLVWVREIGLRGTAYYGEETVPGRAQLPAGRRRAMQVALDVLTDTRPDHLVTHTFGLDEPVEALRTAEAGPAASALKVAFTP